MLTGGPEAGSPSKHGDFADIYTFELKIPVRVSYGFEISGQEIVRFSQTTRIGHVKIRQRLASCGNQQSTFNCPTPFQGEVDSVLSYLHVSLL